MTVSIVVPALDEAGVIAETLRSLRELRPHEIIAVDGGSSDDTARLAEGLADRVLRGPRGRAAQMNAGAAAATGDVLLFLHADCRLGAGALRQAERLLALPRVAAGCYRMRVEAAAPVYRLIDGCATMRVLLTGIVYGDQGLFLRRETFERVGGFPVLRLMEDVFISLALRRLGRIVLAPGRIVVSPRRWRRQGVVRQTLRNWALTAAAAWGVHPDRLARFYPALR
jgi:rSAM/selenodomain-associated transferase 2